VNVLHVTYTFHPDACGGTERYVDSLARALAPRGIRSAIAAPGADERSYAWNGVPVHRFEVDGSPAPVTRAYGADAVAARSFARVLDRERPDLVHLHALTSACSHLLVREAKDRGLPVVFTYHTPTATCLRGTLLQNGTDRCDGRMDPDRCTPCTLHGLGLHPRLARAVDAVPGPLAGLAGRLNLEGGVWTALRMRELVRLRQEVARHVLRDADAIVSLARWVTELLQANGVPRDRIVESAHGIARADSSIATPRRAADPIRIAHLGRVDPVKGTRLLIEALRVASDAAVTLDVFGIVQSDRGRALLDDLHTAAGGDERISFRPPLEPDAVIPTLADFDLIAIPSQWFETGPLVLLEAAAAGVPAIGSDLGGIAEKIQPGVDGLLVRPHDSVPAWAAAIRRLAGEPDCLERLRQGVRPPRTIEDVGSDMSRLYRDRRASTRVAGRRGAAAEPSHA
jgi:glycosyltransferase involved in cell wall biosynthesis